MKRHISRLFIIATLALPWACGPKNSDPQPSNLPAYLRVPASLTSYTGSGRIATTGGLTLIAEGPEALTATTGTYSGVSGKIVGQDITANFTVGQPRPFAESYLVPAAYQANGQLLIKNTIATGTYPMGFETKPTPAGAQADIILNLPGPQLYSARSGSVTISESTLIKTDGQNKLYRLQGTFQTLLVGSGTGAKATDLAGTFDLLLLN